jgi:hypothetical protein
VRIKKGAFESRLVIAGVLERIATECQIAKWLEDESERFKLRGFHQDSSHALRAAAKVIRASKYQGDEA